LRSVTGQLTYFEKLLESCIVARLINRKINLHKQREKKHHEDTRKNSIVGKLTPEFAEILTPEALSFVGALHEEFNSERETLLKLRDERQIELDAGAS